VKKMILLLAVVIIVVLAATFLLKKGLKEDNQSNHAEPVAIQPKINNPIVFKPEIGPKAIQNPYMGFVPPADSSDYTQPHTLVYANFTWRDLEPEKGQYDFIGIEKKYKLNEWKQKNIKLIFRVVLDTPRDSKHMDIPDWLYEEINHDGTWYDHRWGKGFSPNYSNKKLIEYHNELLKALGERYNNDPEIAFIELGSIGHWAEWHTLQQDGIYISFPKLPVIEKYVNQYLTYFDNKILLMRRPHQIAKEHDLGLFNDMFGKKDDTVGEFWSWVTKGYTFWLTDEKMPAMRGFWKTAPSGGEFAPTDHWEDYFSILNFSETIRQLNLTHVSWLGPSSPADYPQNGEMQTRINQFLGSIGYHFRLIQETHPEKAKPDESVNLVMNWENRGVAPFYFQWPLELSLSDMDGNIVYQEQSKTDIRKWLPGEHQVNETLTIPSNLKAGEYYLCVAILDPITGEPGIALEMKGERQDGRYQLGKIIVE
jgi:hypothetical protein